MKEIEMPGGSQVVSKGGLTKCSDEVLFSDELTSSSAEKETWLAMKKINIPFKKPTRKGAYIIVIIIIILIVASLGISINIDSTEDKPTAFITVAGEIYRVDEPIQFLGEDSKGDISEYQWDFDDGNTSEEENPVHNYNVSGWYNVSLVVISKNKMKSSSSKTIGIQLPDQQETSSRGSARYWRPGVGHVTDIRLHSHPNIGDPRTEAHLSVVRPVGSITVRVEIIWYNLDDTEGGSYEYHREDYTATGSDIDLDFTIEPDQLPEEIGDMWATFIFDYILWDGRDGGVSLTASIEFPVDGLSPPWLNE